MVITVAEAARRAGVPRNTMYELAATGRIASVRVGSRGVRIPAHALEDWAGTHRARPVLHRDEHGLTSEADMERRDVAIRDFPATAYDRAKRSAAARGMTIGDYMAALVTLHERLLKSGEARKLLVELDLGEVRV